MVCNMDCFNCIFPDCINDSREPKTEKTKDQDGKKRKSTYYERNREKCLQQVKDYQKRNHEKVIDYMHKYYREHAEAKKDYRRMRYQEQRQDEEFMKKNRERCRIYREKKRRQEA